MPRTAFARASLLVGVFTAALTALPDGASADTAGYVYVNAEGSVAGYAVSDTGVLTAVPGSPYPTVAGATSNCDVMTATYEPYRQVLYVSNPNMNSLSAFRVDTTTGALTPVAGSPFATTGGAGSQPPAGVAFDAAHTYLYAGRGYGGSYGVEGFTIAPDGALTPIAGSPFGVGAGESGFTLVNDPVENTLLTSSNGSDITVLKVNAGGSLTPVTGSPFTGRGSTIHAIQVHPWVRTLAVANAAGTVSGFQLLAGGAVSGPAPATTGVGPETGMAFTPDGDRLYATDWSLSLYGFAVAAGPVFTPLPWSPLPLAGASAVNAMISDDGRFAFVNGNGTLRSFTLNPADGAPSLVSTVSFTVGASACGSGLAYASKASGVLRKTVSPAGPVCAGSALTYRIGWSNTGAQTNADFTVTDTLPAGVRYAAPSLGFWAAADAFGTPVLSAAAWATSTAGPWTPGEPPNGTASPLVLRWVANRVAPAHSGYLSFAVISGTWLADGTAVVNRASATVFLSSSVYQSDQPATVIQRASLSAALSLSPRQVVVTRPLQVVLTVTNVGGAGVPVVVPAIVANLGGGLVSLVSGPTPPSAPIGPGGAQSFTWVYTANGVGTVRFTATGAGADACGLPAAAAATATASITSLEGVLNAPSPVAQGVTFPVSFTVTNFGAASATTVSAVLGLSSGAGFVTYVSGPAPSVPVLIPGGGVSQTWFWTYSATGTCGGAVFTATATGTDSGSSLPVAATGAAAVVVGGDAWDPGDDTGPGGTLLLSTTTYQTHGPHAICASDPYDWFRMPMTAGVTYNMTTAVAGSSGDNYGQLYSNAAGTIQVAGDDDAGGNAQFTITYTGAATQDYYLRIRHFSAGGTWNGSLAWRAVPPVLAASVAMTPDPGVAGRWVQIALTVTNTGGRANAVAPALGFLYGGPALSYVAGPVPASANLLTGGAQTFVWTWSVNGAATIGLTATASGTDPATGLPAAAAASATVHTTILEGAVQASPGAVGAGQSFNVVFTVTNLGSSPATGVSATLNVTSGPGITGFVGGPVPAGPQIIIGGGNVSFTWTLSVTAGSCAGVVFSATAAGIDSGSFEPVSARAAVTVSVYGDVWDPGDNLGAGATLLLSATTYQTHGPHALCAVDLYDWFRVPLIAGGIYNFTTAVPGSAGDDFGQVYTDPGGIFQIAAGDDEGGNAQFSITATGTQTQDHYLRVRHFSVGGTWNGLLAWRAIPSALQARVSVSPPIAPIGGWVQVVLTVSNTGSRADAVTPAIAVTTGAPLVTLIAGPVPVSGSVFAAAARSFTWTYSVNGGGVVRFTATGAGSDAISGAPVLAAASGTLFATTLQAALAVSPPAAPQGTTVTIVLTVTNAGGSAVTGVTPVLTVPVGAGLVAWLAGPAPAFTGTIFAGGSASYAWTYSVTGVGGVAFTGTVAGTDTGTLTIMAAAATATLVAQPAPGSWSPSGLWHAIADAVAPSGRPFISPSPATWWYGQDATGDYDTFGLPNTGNLDSGDMTILPGQVFGFWSWEQTENSPSWDHRKVYVSTNGGGSWTQLFMSAGPENLWRHVQLPLGAYAGLSIRLRFFFDTIDGGANGYLGWFVDEHAVYRPLQAVLTTTPGSAGVGQPFMVTLTLSNTGDNAIGALAVAPFLQSGTGAAVYAAGPSPALPGSLGAGAAVTLTWTYTGSLAGAVTFATTATGVDAVTAQAMTSGRTAASPVLVTQRAQLVAALAGPSSTLCLADPFVVALTVTNTGGTGAINVVPGPLGWAGTAGMGALAGPWPSGTVSIPSGGAVVFTWTGTAATGGTLRFTGTAGGQDAGDLGPVAAPVASSGTGFVTAPVQLTAALALPAVVYTGQTFTVALTVTNTGAGAAPGVSATMFLGAGSGGALRLGGPLPPGPLTLAGAGGGTTFVWTWSATAAGTRTFSVTVSGLGCPSSAAFASGSGNVNILTPPVLNAFLGWSKNPVSTGQAFQMTLTVSNSGGSTATNVTAGLWLELPASTGTAAWSGPAPATLPALAPGAQAAFVWSVTATGAGALQWAGTVTGDAPASPSGAVSVMTVQTPASLAAAVSVSPPAVCAGQAFDVRVTVTNSGQAAAVGFTVGGPWKTGTPGLTVVGLPGVPATLGGNASATFTWRYSAAPAGGLSFTGSASGQDANSGATVQGAAAPAGGSITAAGALAAVVSSPPTASVGQWISVRLTVTNTGAADVTALLPRLAAGPGAGNLIGGASPPGVAVLPPGSGTTFAWTWSVSGAGAIVFTGTAVGGTCVGLSTTASGTASTTAVAVGGLVVQSLTVTPGPNVRYTATLTASAVLRNPGFGDTRVDGFAIGGTNASLIGPASSPSTAPPFVVAGGTTATVTWTLHPLGACGFAGVTLTATGTDLGFVAALPPATAVSSPVGIAGAPATASIAAQPPRVAIRSPSAATLIVRDGCGVPVPDAPVAFVVVAGSGGGVVAGPAMTDASGQAVATLTTGAVPGVNLLRADVTGGANPTATVAVEGLPPPVPTPFLSTNSFNPKKGERIKIRLLLPGAMPVEMRVFNLGGELVRRQAFGILPSGLTILDWDGRTAAGDLVATGAYLIQLRSGETTQSLKVIVLKQ